MLSERQPERGWEGTCGNAAVLRELPPLNSLREPSRMPRRWELAWVTSELLTPRWQSSRRRPLLPPPGGLLRDAAALPLALGGKAARSPPLQGWF